MCVSDRKTFSLPFAQRVAGEFVSGCVLNPQRRQKRRMGFCNLKEKGRLPCWQKGCTIEHAEVSAIEPSVIAQPMLLILAGLHSREMKLYRCDLLFGRSKLSAPCDIPIFITLHFCWGIWSGIIAIWDLGSRLGEGGRGRRAAGGYHIDVLPWSRTVVQKLT